jgi:ribosomal subunit interface protein
MHLEVTFKNLRPRDELRRRAAALFKKLERFLDASAEGTLTVAVEHGHAILELVVAAHGDVFKVIEEDEDLRTALDKLFHTMEGQLRRSKSRRITKRRAGDVADGFVEEEGDEAVL